MPLGISVTDLEIEEAIREAWAVLSTGSAVSPSARRLAAVLLALTGGTQAHPHWITPDDLWRDRLAVLADQGAWLASWGPRPGEPGCQVPPALPVATGARQAGHLDAENDADVVQSDLRNQALEAGPAFDRLPRTIVIDHNHLVG